MDGFYHQQHEYAGYTNDARAMIVPVVPLNASVHYAQAHDLQQQQSTFSNQYMQTLMMATTIDTAVDSNLPASSIPTKSTATNPRKRSNGRNNEDEVDEKVLRRRLQYKLHQRRHRAKQKHKTETLEKEVTALQEHIRNLELRRKTLHDRQLVASRTATTGLPARVCMKFFDVFQRGYSSTRFPKQFAFMRSVLSDEVKGPDYQGIEHLRDQIYAYDYFFSSARFEVQSYDVSASEDGAVVVVRSILHLRPRRSALASLCPNVLHREVILQKIIGQELSLPAKYTFVFPADGIATTFAGEVDLVACFYQAIGNLEDTAICLEGTKFRCTGRIASANEPSMHEPIVEQGASGTNSFSSARMQVEYLLSLLLGFVNVTLSK